MGTYVRSVALTGSDQLIVTGGTIYHGITVRETAGSTAAVRVFDNTSGTGTIIDEVSLAANGAVSLCYTHGLWAGIGVYVDIISGTVEGSVRIG